MSCRHWVAPEPKSHGESQRTQILDKNQKTDSLHPNLNVQEIP